MKITKGTTLKELAFFVCGMLKDAGIDTVLTGGAVVSIYTNEKYKSYDLDFITHSRMKDVEGALGKVGFFRAGRYFRHPETNFFVEFPAPPVSIGNMPVRSCNEITSDKGSLNLLTPTQCVMDRLAAFYFWNDMQALEQAVLVALLYDVNMGEISAWSEEEGMTDKYSAFEKELKSRTTQKKA
jgi:hypothetical protein